MKIRKKIYIASPLFNDREREYNRYIRNLLIPEFDVFLPQEDGLLLEDLVSNGMEKDVAEKIIFKADISAMKDSDIIVAVLDGANIDEGVAFELGYCRAFGKICVGLQTDARRQLPTGNNPMISQSCFKIFHSITELHLWLIANHGNSNQLIKPTTGLENNPETI